MAVRGQLAVTDAASSSTGILRCFAIVCMWPIPRQSTTCCGWWSQVDSPYTFTLHGLRKAANCISLHPSRTIDTIRTGGFLSKLGFGSHTEVPPKVPGPLQRTLVEIDKCFTNNPQEVVGCKGFFDQPLKPQEHVMIIAKCSPEVEGRCHNTGFYKNFETVKRKRSK